jgi:hypothetical protein
MKATIIYKHTSVKEGDHKFFNDFIKFLNKEYPIGNDLTITFTGKRLPKMSTGSYMPKDKIFVLVGDRLNRDILRTLAHEWIHEYQYNVLGLEKSKDIGGRNENQANSIAGELIKKFEQKYPSKEEEMYKKKS